MQKTRSYYWDNIKGLLMLLTVFAHILFQLQNSFSAINSIVDYIYMFHMPAFVFVSGFFGKSRHSHSFEAIARLIFLYFIFNSIMGFMYGFTSLLRPMYSYWYLVALIVWRLTAHRIAKFSEMRVILFSVFLFAGFFPSIDNTLAAARIICFYPYYMAGYLLSEEKSKKLEDKPYLKRLPAGLGCLAAAAVTAYFSYGFFEFSDEALQMSAYNDAMDAVGRIVLLAIAFLMIYAVRNLSVNRKIPFITAFGRNSLWIFILHRPITLLISDLIGKKNIAFIITAALLSTLAICIICGNYIITKYLNKFCDMGTKIFTDPESKKFNIAKLAVLAVAAGYVVSVVKDYYADVKLTDIVDYINGDYVEEDEDADESPTDQLYPVMTPQQQDSFDNAFRLTFAGDLILLEDQVKRAYNGTGYDFSDFLSTPKNISHRLILP